MSHTEQIVGDAVEALIAKARSLEDQAMLLECEAEENELAADTLRSKARQIDAEATALRKDAAEVRDLVNDIVKEAP